MERKKGSIPSWTGAPKQDQQDALHLQVVDNFLVIFLIVMEFTSFQYPSGITLNEIGLEKPAVIPGSVTAAAFAFLYHVTSAIQFCQ